MSDDTNLQLAAWLDGALPDDQAVAFAARVAADPVLAAQAERWRANDGLIAGAFAPLAEQPIESELLVRMGLAPPVGAPVAASPAAANDNPPFWRRYALPLGGALAASLAAVLTLTLQHPAAERDALSLALESTPALAEAKLADGRTVQPTLTVRAADGRWCREYRSTGQLALACRDAVGQWNVVGQANGQGPADPGQGYAAAGGNGSGLDQTYRQIGASDPLDAQAEAGLIAKGWSGR